MRQIGEQRTCTNAAIYRETYDPLWVSHNYGVSEITAMIGQPKTPGFTGNSIIIKNKNIEKKG